MIIYLKYKSCRSQVLAIDSSPKDFFQEVLNIFPCKQTKLLASFDNGMEDSRSLCPFLATEEQRVLTLHSHGAYTSFCQRVINRIITIVAITEQLFPKGMHIVDSFLHQITFGYFIKIKMIIQLISKIRYHLIDVVAVPFIFYFSNGQSLLPIYFLLVI